MFRLFAIFFSVFHVLLGVVLFASVSSHSAIYDSKDGISACYKPATIDINLDLGIDGNQSIHIAVHTKHLLIRSVESCDLSSLVSLFGDPKVMEKYADGIPRTPEQTTARF